MHDRQIRWPVSALRTCAAAPVRMVPALARMVTALARMVSALARKVSALARMVSALARKAPHYVRTTAHAHCDVLRRFAELLLIERAAWRIAY